MSYRVASLATTHSDGAGIATQRINYALEPHLQSITPVVLRRSANDPPNTLAASTSYPSFIKRLRRRFIPSLSSCHRLESRLRRATLRYNLDFELFSLPTVGDIDQRLVDPAAIDIIHLHWISGLIDFPTFFGLYTTPIVWTLHDQYPYLGGFHYEYDKLRNSPISSLDSECFYMKQRALRLARMAVVGNSEWSTNAARASGIFPSTTSFHTVYYPLDLASYSPKPKALARQALGLCSESLCIGFAATDLTNSRKGFIVLVDALKKLAITTNNITLISFGRRPSNALVEDLRFKWHHFGFVDDDRLKSVIYSAMSCFVIPSLAEAFGQTAIEAMACETPVIASHTGGLAEAVGDAGLFFEPNNSQALFECLQSLLGSQSHQLALGRASRKHVCGRHNPSLIASHYLDVYARLLNKQI